MPLAHETEEQRRWGAVEFAASRSGEVAPICQIAIVALAMLA
jgi:hypothetical protein